MKLNKVYQGNSLDVLKTFPDSFVDCTACSPPYWGLRDYGTAKWIGGDENCNHKHGNQVGQTNGVGNVHNGMKPGYDASVCILCHAERIDDQIGLEKTPEEFIAKLVAIFREVKRVMIPTGTLWVNMGDSYCSTAPGTFSAPLRQDGILLPKTSRKGNRGV